MKYKLLLTFLSIGLATGLLVNSCKKDNSGSISTLFTGNSWQLASVTRHHLLNGASVATDTLNTTCTFTQIFTFHTDKTCTYTNFDCKDQPVASGHWSLSPNQLTLMADVTCQDTTAAQKSQPFVSSRIINVGQYSLVLRTGQYNNYYPPNQPVVYTDYGFVRVKSP